MIENGIVYDARIVEKVIKHMTAVCSVTNVKSAVQALHEHPRWTLTKTKLDCVMKVKVEWLVSTKTAGYTEEQSHQVKQ